MWVGKSAYEDGYMRSGKECGDEGTRRLGWEGWERASVGMGACVRVDVWCMRGRL